MLRHGRGLLFWHFDCGLIFGMLTIEDRINRRGKQLRWLEAISSGQNSQQSKRSCRVGKYARNRPLQSSIICPSTKTFGNHVATSFQHVWQLQPLGSRQPARHCLPNLNTFLKEMISNTFPSPELSQRDCSTNPRSSPWTNASHLVTILGRITWRISPKCQVVSRNSAANC
jgi:hypothetical protein